MQHIVAYVAYCLSEKQELGRIQAKVARLLPVTAWSDLMRRAVVPSPSLWHQYGRDLLLLDKDDNNNKETTMDLAVRSGNMAAVRAVLDLSTSNGEADRLLHKKNGDGDYSLCWPIYQQNELAVRLLFARGARIISEQGYTNVLCIPLLQTPSSSLFGCCTMMMMFDVLMRELENMTKYTDADILQLLTGCGDDGYSVVQMIEKDNNAHARLRAELMLERREHHSSHD